MPNKNRSFHEAPEKAGGEVWLYSEQQQKVVQFKPDASTVHAEWVVQASRVLRASSRQARQRWLYGGWKAPSNIFGQWISKSALM